MPQKDKTTPYSRARAKDARAVVSASKYADSFKTDPSAAIQDIITDLLHLAGVRVDVTDTPEDIIRRATANLEVEQDPNSDPVETMVREGKLFSLSGKVMVGRLDRLTAVCALDGITIEQSYREVPLHTGDSDVRWDSQEPMMVDGQEQFVDEADLIWPRNYLVWISDGVPDKVPDVSQAELIGYLGRYPVLAGICQRAIKVGGESVPAPVTTAVACMMNPKTTKTLRRFYRTLKAAVWSWKHIHPGGNL